MPQPSRLRRQDGFIRELAWFAVIIFIIAIIVLDGLALFGTFRGTLQDANTAAEEAQASYAQVQDLQAAKLAAEAYLAKAGAQLVDFRAQKNPEGVVYFEVTATEGADTYAFGYLGKIPPLKDWVEKVTNPVRTGSSL